MLGANIAFEQIDFKTKLWRSKVKSGEIKLATFVDYIKYYTTLLDDP